MQSLCMCCIESIHLCAGTPSPESHLSTPGLWREAGEHGHPSPRGREQHPLLRFPLSRGVQDAKAANSHTA